MIDKNNPMILQATNITKWHEKLQVLKGINLTVSRGEVVAIMGNSGVGKTTLLYILATLDSPDSGKVVYNGSKEITSFNANQLALFRNKEIGFVFQFHHLLPEFTAFENVCIPGYIGGTKKDMVEKKGKELLSLLQLTNRAHHRPDALSGGERQRVAVARALINSPQIVFADEPSGSLDTKNALTLHQFFLQLRDALGQTFVFVTHSQQYAAMGDRKLMMQDGEFL